MARNPNRKQYYAIVRNLTADTVLARKVRDWGADRILLELGINVKDHIIQDTNKKLTQFNTVDRRTKQKQMVLNKTLYLQKKKLDDEDLLNKLKYKTYREIKQELAFRKKYMIKKKASLHPSEIEARIKQWGEWSKRIGKKKKYNTYPFSITQQAMQINKENSLDIYASYGFGMVFYSFTSNKPVEEFMKKYSFDPHTGEYNEVRKKA